MSAALLDVNVLIALLDPRHVHHERAHTWLSAAAPLPWASCPLTENAVLRILGNPRYPNSPGPPAAVAPLLEAWRNLPRHRFWHDRLSGQQLDSLSQHNPIPIGCAGYPYRHTNSHRSIRQSGSVGNDHQNIGDSPAIPVLTCNDTDKLHFGGTSTRKEFTYFLKAFGFVFELQRLMCFSIESEE